MDKRYQIFVSSTYVDLQEERRKVIQTLMEMDCIPSGMELFPAADEEQWAFIRRVIDDCDYYLLIIGARYGSTTSEGISYTEKEYDYALQRGIKVIALLHENPELLPAEKQDRDPELKEQLQLFRDKVGSNRLVKYWKNPEDLPGLVAISLSKTIKLYPAIGWIRADRASNEDLLNQLNDLRVENKKLQTELATQRTTARVEIAGMADLSDQFTLRGEYFSRSSKTFKTWSIELGWGELFSLISPFLLKYPGEDQVQTIIAREAFSRSRTSGSSPKISDQDFQTIKIQLNALGLIDVRYTKTVAGTMGFFWFLTEKGQVTMNEMRIVRKRTDSLDDSGRI